MTNAEKYLKDNVNVKEMKKDFFDYLISDGVYGCNSKNIVQKWEDFLSTKTKPTLTEDERVILRNLKVEKYIFRDSYGDLLISETKPTENEIRCGDLGYVFDIYNHLFKFIKERRRI